MHVMNTIAMLVGYACLSLFTVGGLAFAVVAFLAHQQQRAKQRQWKAHRIGLSVVRAAGRIS